jgi:integrase/recombinase XerD
MMGRKTQNMPLIDLTRAYLDELQVRGLTPKTIDGYRRKLRRFTTWGLANGVITLADFTPEAVKRYILCLQQDTRWSTHRFKRVTRQPKLSPVAIRNYIRDLKPFALWLAEEHYTEENVLAGTRNPKSDETPIEPFTQGELATIFAALDPSDPFKLRDYTLLHLLLDAGLRVGEVVRLTLDDVNLQDCTIQVARTKNRRWRTVGFGKQTHKYLMRYLSMGRPKPKDRNDRHLFLSLDGYPLTEATVQRLCARLSRRTGVHVHCHRFRHTFAVEMLRSGTDLRTLQRLMGHSSIMVTSRYLNLVTDDVIAAYQDNSPGDRFHAHQQAGGRRLPIRRGMTVTASEE